MKKIKLFFQGIGRFIQNVRHYWKFLWTNGEWDWAYLSELLSLKFSLMADSFQWGVEKGIGHIGIDEQIATFRELSETWERVGDEFLYVPVICERHNVSVDEDGMPDYAALSAVGVTHRMFWDEVFEERNRDLEKAFETMKEGLFSWWW